jgi:hypothetical protein
LRAVGWKLLHLGPDGCRRLGFAVSRATGSRAGRVTVCRGCHLAGSHVHSRRHCRRPCRTRLQTSPALPRHPFSPRGSPPWGPHHSAPCHVSCPSIWGGASESELVGKQRDPGRVGSLTPSRVQGSLHSCRGLHLGCPQGLLVPKAAASWRGTLGGEGSRRGLTSSVDSAIDGPIAERIDPAMDSFLTGCWQVVEISGVGGSWVDVRSSRRLHCPLPLCSPLPLSSHHDVSSLAPPPTLAAILFCLTTAQSRVAQ